MEAFKQINSFIIEHNSQFYNIDDIGWAVAESKISGKGVIAEKCFQPGDIIFIDHPMVVGPRSSPSIPHICIICYKRIQHLRLCSQDCSLPICSISCETEPIHNFECSYLKKLNSKESTGECLFDKSKRSFALLRAITLIRCLRLNKFSKEMINQHLHKIDGPQQGFEVFLLQQLIHSQIPKKDKNFMLTCCRVLDANAFEIPLVNNESTRGISVRGLFPMASFMNHSCSPNTRYHFGEEHQMIIRASKKISVGQEITSTYAPLLLGTPARRIFLARSKNFHCQCLRCQDPTEFDTFLSALKCRNSSCVNGVLLPSNPLDFKTDWKCGTCQTIFSANKINVLQKVVAQELSKLNLTKPDDIMKFIQNNRIDIVHDTNHTIVQFKYLLISSIIGYAEGYAWSDVDEKLLFFKIKICEEMFNISRKLKLGQCEIQNICMSELGKTKAELSRRNKKV